MEIFVVYMKCPWGGVRYFCTKDLYFPVEKKKDLKIRSIGKKIIG
jgi:hypothetical protein